jgi:hypothetical protein
VAPVCASLAGSKCPFNFRRVVHPPSNHPTPPPPVADGKWFNFKGRPGGTYNLYTDGGGARLDCTFGAGGFGGKATFVRAIKFTRGTDRVTAVLAKAGKQWVLTGGWAHVQYAVQGGSAQKAGGGASQPGLQQERAWHTLMSA